MTAFESLQPKKMPESGISVGRDEPESPARRKFLKFAVSAAIIALAPTPIISDARENLPPRLRSAESAARWHGDHDFTPEIDQARGVLAKQTAGYTVTRGHLKDYKILLAVKHHKRKQIETVRMSRDGDNPKGYGIDWEKANGVNTNYVISQPDGYSILAVRRVVRLGKSFKEVVYTPFTADIDTPRMRERGLQYLETILDKAYKGLVANAVASKSTLGKSLAEAVPLRVSMILSIIEHIDPSRFKNEKVEKLISEVLVTVAANRELSYAYAVSRAKARGLFQFIPRTYFHIAKQYPGAKLIQEFVAGMNNHVNAAKASLLLFDSDLLQVPVSRRISLLQNRVELAKYLAAAYNGGAPRAARALSKGDNWPARLLPETRVYLEKLQKVTEVFGK